MILAALSAHRKGNDMGNFDRFEAPITYGAPQLLRGLTAQLPVGGIDDARVQYPALGHR